MHIWKRNLANDASWYQRHTFKSMYLLVLSNKESNKVWNGYASGLDVTRSELEYTFVTRPRVIVSFEGKGYLEFLNNASVVWFHSKEDGANIHPAVCLGELRRDFLSSTTTSTYRISRIYFSFEKYVWIWEESGWSGLWENWNSTAIRAIDGLFAAYTKVYDMPWFEKPCLDSFLLHKTPNIHRHVYDYGFY